ncbi:MAG: hypothetical protein JXC85_04955 [Candidatus Aenigmarchaeota archaeon]|nr:hypothetical protein [Candidatus Aenigmarchaeota archaeon]
MNKNMNLALTITAMLLLSLHASLGAAQGPAISLVLTKQTPYPVEPGQVVSIEVSIQNNGSGSETMTLEIIPKEPFTLLAGQEKTKTFTRINAYDSVLQTYKLKVAESAISSTYEVEFRYFRAGTTAYVVKKLPITVQGRPKIVISEVKTDPLSIEPGDEVEITVSMTNEGSGSAYQTELSLTPNLDPETEESVITPKLSGGVFYLGDFMPGEEATATFRLEVANSAEHKTYLSTLVMDYDDESGISQSTSFSMGIPIRGKPIIEVLSAKVDNSAFKVDIENIGTGNAKALKIAFVQNGEIKDSAIANELKPTKAKTLRFQGFSYGNAAINISYLDESNQFFSKEIPVTVKRSVYDEEGTGVGVDSSLVSVLVVIVVLESFYVWRIRKRAKRPS